MLQSWPFSYDLISSLLASLPGLLLPKVNMAVGGSGKDFERDPLF